VNELAVARSMAMTRKPPTKCTSKLCRAGRPHCRSCRLPVTCWCDGMVGKGGNFPHRRGSKGAMLGACKHHPDAADLMEQELRRPIRRAR
jgi:hypothetical protein